MWCKLSHFIVYIMLSIFFVLTFFFSDPFIVKYGDKVFAETFVSRNVDNSKIFPQLPYVSCETKDNGRYVEYKEGIKVLLIVDGKRKTVYSKPCNVSTFLSKEQITLSKDDETSLPLNHELKAGDILIIKRIEYKIYEKDIPIEYRVVTERNPLVEKDVVVVWTPGENGILQKDLEKDMRMVFLLRKI